MAKRTDFYWTEKPEPHSYRRKAILQKYPEIEKLYGYDIVSSYFCTTTVLFQFFMASVVGTYDLPWWLVFVLSYAISGTLNHSITLAIHDLCHCAWFPRKWHNEWYSIVSNCATGFPSAITFKRYHLEHHTSQGVDGVDVDLPTNLEGTYINRVVTKIMFLCLQPFFYSFRPMIVYPKTMSFMEFMNWVFVFSCDVLVFYLWGGKALFYLMGGTVLATTIHPIAGHFIAEHYVLKEGQETYSYYGPTNWLVYNTGYHNEHHDFPRIPGRMLPQVRAIAPEFYDTLMSYDSWGKILIDFIFKDELGCFSRVKRKTVASKEAVYQAADELTEEVGQAVMEGKVRVGDMNVWKSHFEKHGKPFPGSIGSESTDATSVTDGDCNDKEVSSEEEDIKKMVAPPASTSRKRKAATTNV